jgi:phage terminase small subunit
MAKQIKQKITAKQKKFCEQYVIDLNATQAAIRAGYSEKTAYSSGTRTLNIVGVQKYISVLQEKRSQRTEITADKVLKELAKIAFFDIRKAFDEDNNLLPIKSIDNDTAAAITGVEIEELGKGIRTDWQASGHVQR